MACRFFPYATFHLPHSISRRGTEVVITGAPRKRLACQKRARGFESHPLRHNLFIDFQPDYGRVRLYSRLAPRQADPALQDERPHDLHYGRITAHGDGDKHMAAQAGRNVQASRAVR